MRILPRSTIHHISREAPDEFGIIQCVVEIDEWMLAKYDL